MATWTARLLVALLAGLVPLAAARAEPAPVRQFEREVVDPVRFGAGRDPKALADVDGDGDLDAIAMRRVGTAWYEFPSWTRHEIDGLAGKGEAAQAADLDGDGDVDFVISSLYDSDRDPGWFENPLADGGDPTGPWTVRPIGYLGRDGSHDVEVADLDLDGRPDVVTNTAIFFNRVPADPADRIDWQEVPSETIVPGRGLLGTAVGDVDGDGDPDLVAPSASEPWPVLWFENPLPAQDPATTPWTARTIGPGFDAPALAVADLDEDGRADVLVAPAYQLGGLSWFAGPADPTAPGAVWTWRSIDPTVNFVHNGSIFAVDLNGDTAPDLVLAEQEQGPTDRVLVYYNRGDALAWSEHVLATTAGLSPRVGDVDGNGTIDILNAASGYFGQENPLELWRNTGSPDATAPIVSDLRAVAGRTSATLFWNSDEPADGEAVWDVGPGSDRAQNRAQQVDHALVMPGLACGTDYDVMVRSTDAAGNASEMASTSLSTLACGPESDLVGAWPFEEGAGSAAFDASGNGLDGTLVGAGWTTETGDGSASALDFADDYVAIGEPAVDGGALSLALWMRPRTLRGANEDARLLSKATGTDEQDHVWMLGTVRSLNRPLVRFRVRTDDTSTLLGGYHAQIAEGQWHHVAGVYDGIEMRLYLDGVEVASAPKTGPLDAGIGVAAAIGDQPAGAGSRPFDGQIDDVRIYRRALDAGEVAVLARVPEPGAGAGLAAAAGSLAVLARLRRRRGGAGARSARPGCASS